MIAIVLFSLSFLFQIMIQLGYLLIFIKNPSVAKLSQALGLPPLIAPPPRRSNVTAGEKGSIFERHGRRQFLAAQARILPATTTGERPRCRLLFAPAPAPAPLLVSSPS